MKTLLAAATLALTITAGALTAHAQGPMPPPPGGPFHGREFGPPPPRFERPPMPPPPRPDYRPEFRRPRHAHPMPPPEPPYPPPPRSGPPLLGFLRFVFER